MTWGSWLKPRDAKGRESRTLAFVGLTWLLMTLRFALGGLSFDAFGVTLQIAQTAMIDYGAAVAAVLAIWLGREAIWSNFDKSAKGKTDV